MRNKKIFFVADANSIHTAKWVNYFVDKNYDVYLATFALKNNTKCKKIYFLGKNATNVSGGNYHYLFSINKLAKIFKTIQPDIINAHYSYSMGFVSLLAKNISKIKSEFTIVCHGSDVLAPPKALIFDLVNKYVLKNSDKIFAVSDQIKDKLNNFGIDLTKVFVGQYGIEIDNKSHQKDIDILSNRNFTSNSRIEFMLDALIPFKDRNLNIVFVLPHIKDKKLEEFEKEFPFITFYKQVDYQEMMDMVSRTKVYISATESDGSSLSLLEAMSKGVVPVISNIVSNRSWVLDDINGYLFDTKKQFQNKINKVLNDNLNSMNSLNKTFINEKCSYNKQMHKIEEFLL